MGLEKGKSAVTGENIKKVTEAVRAGAMAKAFHKVSQFQLWVRRIIGIIFLIIGIYFTLAYTLGLRE